MAVKFDRIVPKEQTPYFLEELERRLKAQVIGQDIAIRFLMDSLYSAKSGLIEINPYRTPPIGNFLLTGPTGSGKTYLCEILAKELDALIKARVIELSSLTEEEIVALPPEQQEIAIEYYGVPVEDIEKETFCRFLKIDGAHFSEQHNIASLIGSPDGYVGSDKAPLLNPDNFDGTTIFLIDEIEKAIDHHGNMTLFDMLLDIMETGLIENRRRQKVSFGNTIIMMTSNIGVREMLNEFKKRGIGFKSSHAPVASHSLDGPNARIHKTSQERAEQIFKPEFINRLTKIITFRFLEDEHYRTILGIKLAKIQATINALYAKRGTTPPILRLSRAAENLVLSQGISREFGARPLEKKTDRRIKVGNREDGFPGLDFLIVTNSVMSGEDIYGFVEGEIDDEGNLGAFSRAAQLLQNGIVVNDDRNDDFKVVDKAHIVFYRKVADEQFTKVSTTDSSA